MRKLFLGLVLAVCGSVGAAPLVPDTSICMTQATGAPFWYYCPDVGERPPVPPEGVFVRTFYDEFNSVLVLNGVAYAVNGEYFLIGSNEPIGKSGDAQLVIEVMKGVFVTYKSLFPWL